MALVKSTKDLVTWIINWWKWVAESTIDAVWDLTTWSVDNIPLVWKWVWNSLRAISKWLWWASTLYLWPYLLEKAEKLTWFWAGIDKMTDWTNLKWVEATKTDYNAKNYRIKV
jgi:hypothetical protein